MEEKMSIVFFIFYKLTLYIKNNVTTKLQHEIMIIIQFAPPPTHFIAGNFADMQLPYKQT